jgi:hypothetical protein
MEYEGSLPHSQEPTTCPCPAVTSSATSWGLYVEAQWLEYKYFLNFYCVCLEIKIPMRI